MDDMISRKAALDAIDCWHIDFNSMDGAKVQTDCWKTIKELPAVDAVPVVRCRDCKESIENAKHIDMACERSYDPNFYCADGERRDT